MTEDIKKTSKDWRDLVPKRYQLQIIDYDGWDRDNFTESFNVELITKTEFMSRLGHSTIFCNNKLFSEW